MKKSLSPITNILAIIGIIIALFISSGIGIVLLIIAVIVELSLREKK